MQGVFLALGGNQDDRQATILAAQAALNARGVQLVHASPLYENPALLPEGAPAEWNMPFLNQVIEVQTDLAPELLLEEIKEVEKELGRTASPRWSPRPIDIDILAYHDLVVNSQRLSIPHPEWYKRDFVVIPWHYIAPNWQWHGMSLKQLRGQFTKSNVSLYAA